jgi:hypothetical protein
VLTTEYKRIRSTCLGLPAGGTGTGLSKLARNHPVDREDIAYLARTVPLRADVLRKRYREELRPIIIGDPKVHDHTLDMCRRPRDLLMWDNRALVDDDLLSAPGQGSRRGGTSCAGTAMLISDGW